MPEIKLNGPTMEQRIANRLRNSGDGTNPNVRAVHGTGPTRTHTNIHHAAKQNAPPTA
jgi:hypothetical protein